MAKDNVIGLAMGLDVTDLKAGIKEVSKLVKSSKDEFNLATAGMEQWTKSSEGLNAKLKQLNSQLDAQKKSVAGYKAEIERVSNLEGDHTVQLEQLKAKLNSAEIAVKKTEVQINKYSNSLSEVNAENKKAESSFGKLTNEIEKQKAELSELEFEYKDAVTTYGKNSKEAKSLAKQITNLNKDLQKNQKEVKHADKQLELLEQQFNDTEEEAKDFSGALDNIKGLGSFVGKGIATIGASVAGLATAFFATAESTKEFRTNMGKVETAFEVAGLKADEATETYKNLYAVVADEGKATEATAHIAKLAKSQEDLKKWTEICTGVYATFGDSLPIENLTEASNETAKTGKITGGLADALNWAGVSEEKFQEKLDNLSSEQERNKLITETLNGLYDEASQKYQQTNKDVIESNKSQANLTATMAEFGKQAEPILSVVREGFGKILQAVMDLMSGADFEGIKTQIENAFSYFVDTIIPTIVDGFQWIMDNKDVLIAGIVGIGTAMLAWNVVSIIQGVVSAIKAWTAATEGLTLAQKLLNLAMKANIIGIIITAVTTLIAILITLWNTSDGFRKFWIDLWNKIKEVCSVAIKAIGKFFSNLWKDIKVIWGKTVDWFKNIGSKIADGFKKALDKVKNFFSNTWKNIKNIWGKVNSWFSNVVTKIVNAFKNIPNKLKTYFSNAWNNIKKIWSTVSGWFSKIKENILNAFKSIPSKIKTFFSNAWSNVKSAWSNPKKFFTDVKDKIINAFKELPSKMLSVGKNLIEGLWNGVKNMSSWISGKLKGFSEDVLGGIKKFFGIKSPSRKMAEVGNFLVEGLAQGVEKNKRKATKATDAMGKEIMQSIAGIEEQLEQSKIDEKILSFGGKVKNPFDDWSNAELNKEINVLEKKLKHINEQLIDNGVTQEQWNTSSEKMNERAKILEERLQTQNDLMNLFNAKIKMYNDNEVPEWVTDGIEKLQEGIEVTTEEARELNKVFEEEGCEAQESLLDKISDTATGMKKNFDKASANVVKSFENIKQALEPIKEVIASFYSQIMDIVDMALDLQMQEMDAHLRALEEKTDEEIKIKEEATEKELAQLDELLEKDVITYEEYTKRKELLENQLAQAKKNIEDEALAKEKEINAQKNEIAKKQFNAEKVNNIAQATIDGARAIVKLYTMFDPATASILAVAQGALTATQIALIAKQQFVPMFAKGGVVNSPTLGVIGEAGKEVVMPLENNTGWINELAYKLNSIMEKDFVSGVSNHSLQPVYAGDTTNNYNYNQVINAPKLPSRKEIYRDTKNLLALKGV